MHKTTDKTGIIPVDQIKNCYDQLLEAVRRGDPLKTRKGKSVDPQTLIPFYESFGIPAYQCFWAAWHHELGMGNIYISLSEKIVADPEKGQSGTDNLAFSTFTEWLLFYLEPIS